MRGGMTVLLVFLICLVVVVLYIFLGRAQIVRGINELREEDAALQSQLSIIREKEEDLPRLMASLPVWSRQLRMFNQAIPSKMNDNVFLADLVSELEAREIKILNLETTQGGPWLGQITEEMEVELESIGINVAAARSIKVAFYSATVVAEFDAVLDAFESMKKYNRLYTLDFVSGPAAAGAGSMAETLDLRQVPMTFSGSLYYGIGEEEVSQETLNRVFNKAISGPAARNIFEGVQGAGRDMLEADLPGDGAESAAGQSGADQAASGEIAMALTDGQEGWLR